ncbi:hypothetical protein ABPG74_003169 [Tetrahymena malaccensis]
MKISPIFAIFFAALLLSSVYLIQKQPSLEFNDSQTCYVITRQQAMLATLIYLENVCQKQFSYVIEYHKYDNTVSQETTDCLGYQQKQLVGSYGGDDESYVNVLRQIEC